MCGEFTNKQGVNKALLLVFGQFSTLVVWTN